MTVSTLSRPDTLLTREAAAAYLGVLPQTLAAWHSTGRYSLPVIKVGRSVRYRQRDLDTWIEHRVQTHSGQSL